MTTEIKIDLRWRLSPLDFVRACYDTGGAEGERYRSVLRSHFRSLADEARLFLDIAVLEFVGGLRIMRRECHENAMALALWIQDRVGPHGPGGVL